MSIQVLIVLSKTIRKREIVIFHCSNVIEQFEKENIFHTEID